MWVLIEDICRCIRLAFCLIARYPAFFKNDMTEGNQEKMQKRQLGTDWESNPGWKCTFTMSGSGAILPFSSLAALPKCLNQRIPRISHRLLLCSRSCRIFGLSFWCSWNSPRSMLLPSPEDCAITSAIQSRSKNGRRQFFLLQKDWDLGRGSGGRRKCRWSLWSVRPLWIGRAGICKQSECQRGQRWANSVFGTEYEYEYYSGS